ncbi:MAG TPA: hypothetical protein DIU15_03015 [Deltaproteobacteria bacterium]|nr:hypothetical protein [Deltaproteobacteria bacterium]HCP44981.1 hypothetical protein [Deltaproteobacteria bacterium]
MYRIWLTLLTVAMGMTLVAGCEADGGDTGDDQNVTEDAPLITRMAPSADTVDFFFQANLEVEWNLPPTGATLSLTGADGAAMGGVTEMSSSGRILSFNPDADLTPDSTYSVTVTWNSESSPVDFSFQTGSYGNEVGADTQDGLVGRVFNLDLASANFVEPPGVGGILQSQIGDVAILFTMTAESNFDAAAQPGLHILGAIGEVEGGQVSQGSCTETLTFTYGVDGVQGTADDTPARWSNPQMELGPTNLDIAVQGFSATIENLVISGTFHPDLDDMRGGTFAGKVDTRPLAPELDPEGGENAICELVVETVGVECEPCNEDGSEPFCLSVVAEDVAADGVEGMTLTPTSCADIITGFVADGVTCQEEAEAYDTDADADGVLDGTYPDCPAYAANAN